ncbi:patatin-like phospholipase family protein [Legionella sp. 29fVS95]|uniref:patatin-like phospholipase family protein n=1 Tax=Legionella sp. 29fVS95 TaxID=3402813 RepID=UPI003AF69E44
MKKIIVVIFLILSQSACQIAGKPNPVPAELENAVQINDFPDVRTEFTNSSNPLIKKQSLERIKQLAKTYPDTMFHQKNFFSLLIISGGGDYGAFGAGILNGWTKSGKRPSFTTVTGISTGALIAPLAFAGPKYDQPLKEVYTTITSKEVITDKPILWTLATGGESLKGDKPLQNLLDRYISPQLLDDIAKGFYQGRRLYVGTTNLYSRKLVVWDLTRLAASRNPKKIILFKKVLLASASIPAVLPPVYIDVVNQGKSYQEMHVDGSTTFAVFLSRLGSDIHAARSYFKLKQKPNVKIFVIRNNQNRFPYKIVQPKLLSIGRQALDSVLAAQGSADVIFIYLCALLQEVDFNLTYVPANYVSKSDEMFDKQRMNELFRIGYNKAVRGNFWEKIPPDVIALHQGRNVVSRGQSLNLDR